MIVAAPHWFVDGDGSVHVIVALSTSTSPFSQQIYEMHPTASDFSTWSTPTLLISTMGAYDPCVVLDSGTYYLFFSSIVGPAIISVCSASSLTGTYSAPSALGINGEGANVVKLGSTWYLYHDNNYPQLDFWNGSNEYATASSPGGTWTNQTRIAHDVTSNDGWFNTRGLKRVAVLNLDGSYVIPGIAPILSGESWPLHYINSIESTTGFSGAVGGRLGLSRLGLLRLGTWVANTSNPITPTPIAPAAPAIRSAEVWPRPIVTGPITVSPIPSGESWPTPLINVEQTVSFGAIAIASGETWPSPLVFIAQSIDFGAIAIPSGETWPTPDVRGGIQFLNVVSLIPSGETWPSPTVTGGEEGLFLFIGKVDFSRYLARGSTNPLTIRSQTIGRWQATFDLDDPSGALNPQLGQTVLVLDFGLRVFAGCIQQVIWDRQIGSQGPNPQIRWHIIAADKSSICDHRVITGKTYPAVDPITGIPTQVSTVIIDIVQNFLNGEGIIPSGVPIDGSLGTLDADLPFNFPTVTQAFDQIALLSGTVWWIDVDGVLTFSALANLPVAPFSLSEFSQNWRASQSGGINTGGGLTTTRTTKDYLNKLYAVSNLNIIPGSGSGGGSTAGSGQTETINFTVGRNGVRIAIDPITGLPYAQAILTSVGIGSVSSMKVNGIDQTVVDIAQYSGQTSTGPNDYLWFFSQGNTAVAWSEASPPVGASIVITYVPFVATNASLAQYGQALSPVDPSSAPLGTCGSGIYEGVVQVKDVSSQDDLNAIAQAQLERIGGIPTIVDFQTDFPGLTPGMLLNVDVPLSGIPIPQAAATQLLVTSVQGVEQGLKLPSGSSFKWDVQATSQLDPGNAVKWQERLLARTQNALPVLQQESATFISPASTALTGGVTFGNPYPVKRTGLVTTIMIAAATPPLDQDLLITITRNGSPIATVKLAAGSVANVFQITAVPKSNQIYFYSQDALNATVTYQISGPNPLKASGVTLSITWVM